jgi:hypothetical protein
MKPNNYILPGIVAIVATVVAQPIEAETTLRGYMASTSKELLQKATQYCVQKDDAALKELMDTGLVFWLKPDVEVEVMETKLFSGLVKIRPRGSTLEVWTHIEAIKP